jgi:serine/threonine protein kinase
MTMELVDANSAFAWMDGEYSNAEAMRLILSCCEAVAYAHRKGIVHGDLKPGNVLVLGDGRVKLIDFGSVVSDAEAANTDAKLEATPQYASPSVLAGNMAEIPDDVFALGCLAYMILARGRHPFDRKPSSEAARAQLRVPFISGIPLRLFEVVTRALAWDPAQRHASVRELQHALLSAELSGDPEPERQKPTARTAPNAQPEPSAPKAKPSPPPPRDRPAKASGDYSYLSKFRGYVAGPLMDVSEPDVPRPDVESHLDAASSAPRMRGSVFSDPVSSDAASSDDGSLDDAADDAASLDAVTLDPESFAAPSASNAVPADTSFYEFSATGPTLAREPEPQQSRPTRASGRGTLVYAMAVSLVLVGVIGAVMSSQHFRSHPALPVQAARSMQLPELTIPTPTMQPVPMPSVSVARLETARSRTEKPTTDKPATNKSRTASNRRRPAPAAESSPTVAEADVSFASRGVEVSPNQKLVAIPLRRSSANRGAVRVAWQIEGERGRQLLDLNRAGAQVIQFRAGQATRTLYVPLRKEAGELVADGVRSFRVKLRQVDETSSAVAVVEEPEIRVTLLDAS